MICPPVNLRTHIQVTAPRFSYILVEGKCSFATTIPTSERHCSFDSAFMDLINQWLLFEESFLILNKYILISPILEENVILIICTHLPHTTPSTPSPPEHQLLINCPHTISIFSPPIYPPFSTAVHTKSYISLQSPNAAYQSV